MSTTEKFTKVISKINERQVNYKATIYVKDLNFLWQYSSIVLHSARIMNISMHTLLVNLHIFQKISTIAYIVEKYVLMTCHVILNDTKWK